jgi:hypothetical protein
MMRRRLTASILGSLALLTAAEAQAQTQAQKAPLSTLLVDLIRADIVLAPPATGFSHEAHYIPTANQQIAPFIFNQQMVTQLATFPLGSPAGGFSFTFDPSAGALRRATESFGPAFAERALTNGKGKLTIGTSFQYSKYSAFEGQSLKNGDVKFYLEHQNIGGSTPFFFEGDLIEAALKLDLSSSTTTFFGNYGITNRWDLAVAVPVVHVSLDATVDATILRLATGANSTTHTFTGGGTSRSFNTVGNATGVGDVLVRTKYRLFSRGSAGLAAGVDLRLPTGDEENLLGTGATAATLIFVGSSTHGRFSPHVNVGYTGSNSGAVLRVPNEFGFRVGTEYTVSPTVTISGTLISRTLLDVGRLKLADRVHNYRCCDANGTSFSTTLRDFQLQPGSLNDVSIAVGGKANLTRTLLLSANVLVSLVSRGLTSRVTPVVGLDYTF